MVGKANEGILINALCQGYLQIFPWRGRSRDFTKRWLEIPDLFSVHRKMSFFPRFQNYVLHAEQKMPFPTGIFHSTGDVSAIDCT